MIVGAFGLIFGITQFVSLVMDHDVKDEILYTANEIYFIICFIFAIAVKYYLYYNFEIKKVKLLNV